MAREKTDPKTGLTKRQAIFCELYCNYGERGGAKAYRDAGYAPKNADGDASKLLNHPPVQRRIDQIMSARPSRDKPIAYERMLRIVESGKDEVALAASKHVLSLGGLVPTQQINVAHEHRITLPSPEEVGNYLRRLAATGIITINEDRFARLLEVVDQRSKLIDVTPQ